MLASHMPCKVPHGHSNTSSTTTITPCEKKQAARKIVNPYAKQKTPALQEAPLPSFHPGHFSAQPNQAYQQLSQPSGEEQENAEPLLGQQTPTPTSSNSSSCGEDNEDNNFSGLFDSDLSKQTATRTRKKRGQLIAKLEIPINQISEELVSNLAAEVAKKVLKDKDFRKEMLKEFLPELAKCMCFTFTEPKAKKRRTA